MILVMESAVRSQGSCDSAGFSTSLILFHSPGLRKATIWTLHETKTCLKKLIDEWQHMAVLFLVIKWQCLGTEHIF